MASPPRSAATPAVIALGRTVRQRRLELRMSPEELGFRSRLDPGYLRHLECGEADPSVAEIRRVGEALGLPLSTLFGRCERAMSRDRLQRA